MKFFVFPAALVALVFLESPATATTLSMSLVYAQAYDASLTPLGTGVPIQPGTILRFDVRMSLVNPAVNEDFGDVTFDINLSPGLEALDLGSGKWMSSGEAEFLYSYPSPPPAVQSYSQYDSNGPLPAGIRQQWFTNDDFVGKDSPKNIELRYINVSVLPGDAANRQYGEANRPAAGYADQLGSPTLMGSVVVKYNGPGVQTIQLSPATIDSWGTWFDGRGPMVSHPNFSGTLVSVPEPSTFALLALGALGISLHRKRRLN